MDARHLVSETPAGSGERTAADGMIAWPPPGLERVQGDLRRVTSRLFFGALVFSTPLLASTALRQDFWSLGLFGEAWWIVIVTTLLGLALLCDGFVGLFRLLRRAGRAADQGYLPATIALVLADSQRDTGFLIQGAREFSEMSRTVRASMLQARLVRSAFLFAGALWLSAGFGIGVLLAARGRLGEPGLAWWTILPAALTALVASLIRGWEQGHLRSARRAWFKRPWVKDLEREDIQSWHRGLADRPDALSLSPSAHPGGGGLRTLAGVSLLLPLLVTAVALSLLVITAVGPLLANVAVPSFERTQKRGAQVEGLVEYRLPADARITARDAGDALVALASVGGLPQGELARAPLRSYETTPFFSADAATGGATGLPPAAWAGELVPKIAEGLDPEVVTYLAQLGAHPALAELRTLAYAPALDDAGAIWKFPLPEGTSVAELPIPRFSGVREAAYAHIGGAIADAARGRVGDAELRLREVISAGLLLGDQGGTLLSNLIGYVIANAGAQALAELLEATGRSEEGLALHGRLDAAQRIADRAQLGHGGTLAAALKSMPATITDENAIRGLRWEYFMTLSALGPCINPNRGLFGSGPDFDRWRAAVRANLVRTPAEEEIFEIASLGWFGGEPQNRTWARVLSAAMGNPTQGNCMSALAVLK